MCSVNILKQPVLVVEDNDDDVFFVRRALKQAGFQNEPNCVGDGQQAMAYLAGEGAYADRTRYPMPRLILLDLQLPHQHGFDVLRWINDQPALRNLVVVVVLTHSSHAKDIALAYKLGACSFLVKPPSPDQLKELAEFLRSDAD